MHNYHSYTTHTYQLQGLVPQENKASDHVLAALEPFTKEQGGPLLVRGSFVFICIHGYRSARTHQPTQPTTNPHKKNQCRWSASSSHPGVATSSSSTRAPRTRAWPSWAATWTWYVFVLLYVCVYVCERLIACMLACLRVRRRAFGLPVRHPPLTHATVANLHACAYTGAGQPGDVGAEPLRAPPRG